MKLSELEKLTKEDMLGGTIANLSALAEADPADVLTLCTTFREMLEALQQATNQLRHDSPNDEVWKRARAAIKKAEGML